MKQIETAEIARAIANIAIGMGAASTVPMADGVMASIVDMFSKQLRAKDIHVEVQHTNEGYLKEQVQKRVLGALKEAQQGLSDSAISKRFFHKMTRIIAMLSNSDFDGIEAKHV